MREQYALTYDFGSGSVKTAMVDRNHRILASCNKPYLTYYPQKGWAVQDPEALLACMVDSTREVMVAANALPCQIKGIAISHTGSTIIFVDDHGKALSDCVMWMDGRAITQAQWLNEQFGQPLYTGKNVIAKLRWFLENQPELVAASYKMLGLDGYLLHHLTGEMVYEQTTARTTRLYDVRAGCWEAQRFAVSGFPRRLICERVVRSDELVGRITAKAARLLGLAEGTPVFGGCCDHATAMLGAGCTHLGDAHIYIGTSAWLAVTAPDYEDCPTIRQSPVPGQWYHYQESDSGGVCIDFLIRNYYQKELAGGQDVYTMVGEESADGASYRDVLFLPFLSGASAPISDVCSRASLLNLESSTTRGQIARAVLEGIGFNLLWLKQFYAQQHGWNVPCLRGIGGGMLLPESVQTIANILGDRIAVMRDPRFAGNIGLSVCVEQGLQEHRDGYAVLDSTTVFDRVYEPQTAYRAHYDRLFAIYQSAFHALSPIYKALNSTKG